MTITLVQYSHADTLAEFPVELTGRDPQAHAEQVLAAWLTHTAEAHDLELDDCEAPDEWSVDRVDVYTDRVHVVAVPYRGEDVSFLWEIPEL